jgi:hypothetical protein
MKPFHPLADVFPLIEGEEFDGLAADIKAYGLREPIVIYDDKVLDGRNRARACEAAGVEPTYVPYQGGDPIAFVISQNLRRRHLDESQRALVAARLANAPAHRPADKSANLQTSQSDAASLLNVSTRSVASAAKVRDHGAAELVRAVEQGEVKVSAAAEIVDLPKEEQREAVEGGRKGVAKATKKVRSKKRGQTMKDKRKAAKDKKREEAAERHRAYWARIRVAEQRVNAFIAAKLDRMEMQELLVLMEEADHCRSDLNGLATAAGIDLAPNAEWRAAARTRLEEATALVEVSAAKPNGATADTGAFAEAHDDELDIPPCLRRAPRA